MRALEQDYTCFLYSLKLIRIQWLKKDHALYIMTIEANADRIHPKWVANVRPCGEWNTYVEIVRKTS